MINPESEFMKALINVVIPSALLGAVTQIAMRMLNHEITFLGAFLTLVVAGGISIPIGMYAYHVADPFIAAAITAFTGMFSRDIARWVVYGSNIDKALTKIGSALVEWVIKKFK